MKLVFNKVVRLLIFVLLLAGVASCFSSSFTKRKFTKGYYFDRIQLSSGDQDRLIRESLKNTFVVQEISNQETKLINVETDEIKRTNKEFSNSAVQRSNAKNSIIVAKNKIIKEAINVQRNRINQTAETLSNEVRSSFLNKGLASPYADMSIVGTVMFLGGILLLLVMACIGIFSAVEFGAFGCVLLVIGFISMSVGAILAFWQ